jgi:hypothetical protein
MVKMKRVAREEQEKGIRLLWRECGPWWREVDKKLAEARGQVQ